MKITLAFLLLGTCLAFTNARSVPEKKPTQEAKSLSHVRMLVPSLIRFRELQECHECPPSEKSCKLRVIILDCFLLLNLMAYDRGVELKQLLSVETDIDINVLIDALKKNDHESYASQVEKTGSINSFMKLMVAVVKGSTNEAGLHLRSVLGDGLDDTLGDILRLFPDLLGGLLGSVGGIVNGVVDAVGDLANVASGALSGLTSGLGDLTGGLLGSFSGLTSGLGGLTSGLSGLADALGSLTSGLGGGKKG